MSIPCNLWRSFGGNDVMLKVSRTTEGSWLFFSCQVVGTWVAILLGGTEALRKFAGCRRDDGLELSFFYLDISCKS